MKNISRIILILLVISVSITVFPLKTSAASTHYGKPHTNDILNVRNGSLTNGRENVLQTRSRKTIFLCHLRADFAR